MKKKKVVKKEYDYRRTFLVFTIVFSIIIGISTYWIYAYKHKHPYLEDNIINYKIDSYVKTKGNVVYLENIIGNDKHLHSAEVVTAFERKFWGKDTKICARKFVMYCFKKLKLKKLKALVFKENFRTESILKACGMTFEALLKAETLKNNKLQDIKIYSIIRGKRNEHN